ncbi:MAG: hypothetical protein LC796_13385 [Acidobacteria bacterium]|nr:hypothetical protein [Acidobacteriota bacterium]
MSAAVAWLASGIALPAAGAPLLLHPAFRPLGVACRAVLAAAAGAVVLSWTMTVLTIARVPWTVPLLVPLTAAQCFALRLALGRRGPPVDGDVPRDRSVPLSAFERLGIVVCGGAVLAAFAAALAAAATSPDLLLFWGPKAEVFAAARRIDDGFLGEPFLRYLHTSYPPLVTNLYAFATLAAGRLPWMAAVATSPLLLGACAMALPGILRRFAGRSEAIAATAAIAACLGFLSHSLEIAGNADMALLLFQILAMALLLGPDVQRRPGQLLAGLLFAGAAAAKVEGLPFVLAAGALFLRTRRRNLPWPSAPVLLFGPAALSLGAWFVFGRRTYLFGWYEGYGRTLDIHWERLPLVLAGIGSAMWRAGAALAWLVPLAAWVVARSRSRGSLSPVGLASVLSAFFVFTYLHGGQDPTLWIQWSAGRIFMVLVPLLVLAAVSGPPASDAAGSAGRKGKSPALPG